jgi:hypothetical protein
MEFDRETITRFCGVKAEGYWKCEDDTSLPEPIMGETAPNELITFIDHFSKVWEYVSLLDNTYLLRSEYVKCAKCLICGEPIKGTGETVFVVKGRHPETNIHCNDIIVPDGYIHYLTAHNVKPSREFFNYITSFDPRDYQEEFNCRIEEIKRLMPDVYMWKTKLHKKEYKQLSALSMMHMLNELGNIGNLGDLEQFTGDIAGHAQEAAPEVAPDIVQTTPEVAQTTPEAAPEVAQTTPEATREALTDTSE